MGIKLLPGDVLLTVPLKRPLCLPRFSQSALCGLWTALWYRAAHAALWTGQVVEQSMKQGMRALDWHSWLENEHAVYRQFWVYIVRPKHATRMHRPKVVGAANDRLQNGVPYGWKNAFTMPLLTRKPYKHPEPDLQNGVVCSVLVAWLLKQAGINIGKRSSIAFTPGTFLHSKKFKTIAKMLYSDGKAVEETVVPKNH